MKAMYNRIGCLFCQRLLSDECISSTKSPEVAKVISNNSNLEGWDMLLALRQGSLVQLGARPNCDLDAKIVAIQLLPGETYHVLYERCNKLSQEYVSQCQHLRLCPRIKLLQKFLNKLMRSSIYIQYLLDYETKLIEHIENFGENDYSVPLPFTIKNVYDHL